MVRPIKLLLTDVADEGLLLPVNIFMTIIEVSSLCGVGAVWTEIPTTTSPVTPSQNHPRPLVTASFYAFRSSSLLSTVSQEAINKSTPNNLLNCPHWSIQTNYTMKNEIKHKIAATSAHRLHLPPLVPPHLPWESSNIWSPMHHILTVWKYVVQLVNFNAQYCTTCYMMVSCVYLFEHRILLPHGIVVHRLSMLPSEMHSNTTSPSRRVGTPRTLKNAKGGCMIS